MSGTATWRNWARTESATPVRRVRPRDVHEVAAAVRAAARDGLPVKPVGAAHSFSAAAVTDGVALDLTALDRVRGIDRGTCTATVEAGIRLHALSPRLWHEGLALENLGDIDRQTLAGALATSTHGTGSRFGGLASRVRGLQLVLADGEVVTCSAGERPDLFAAARVGLGAFGVVTAVTLDCVPAFPVRAREEPSTLAAFLDEMDDLLARHDHVEFFWFPHADGILRLVRDRLPPDEPLDPPSRWSAFLNDEVLANGALALVSRLGVAAPRAIPALNRTATRLLSAREYSDRSYRVFANRRRVRFRETEWALPVDALRPVLAEVQQWLDRPGSRIGFPLEVRFGAAEEPWLALGHGRATCYVSAQTYLRQPHEPYFAAVQEIALRHGGRPHWGKMHGLRAEQLRELYPRFDDALAVRDAVDPERRFANRYTRQVLGD